MNKKFGFSEETLGGSPPPSPLTKGLRPLDTGRRKGLNGINKQLPPAALGLVRYRGFWPMESRENPRGKARFPLRDYSPAFSGCTASGLAAFSRRARSTKSSNRAVLSKLQREPACSPQQVISAGEGPGASRPWSGVWGRRAPNTPPLSNPDSTFMHEPCNDRNSVPALIFFITCPFWAGICPMRPEYAKVDDCDILGGG